MFGKLTEDAGENWNIKMVQLLLRARVQRDELPIPEPNDLNSILGESRFVIRALHAAVRKGNLVLLSMILSEGLTLTVEMMMIAQPYNMRFKKAIPRPSGCC
jgi:hypothetical protein